MNDDSNSYYGCDNDMGICSNESTPLNGSRKTPKGGLSMTRNSSTTAAAPCRRNPKERFLSSVAIGAAVLAMCLGVGLFLVETARGWYESFGGLNRHHPINQPQRYDEMGRFIVEDYDASPAFADFLPGLAGIYGKPLYAFYTNRGQGIASFGVKSKDFPIMEFQSANKAFQNTAFVGFRTFLQGSRGKQPPFLTEPFGALTTRFPGVASDYPTTASSALPSPYSLPKRYMYIGRNELQIREIDTAQNIETNVTYFVLPEEDFGAFVRRTTITNKAKKGEPLTLSVLDGLARIEPSGGKLDGYLKDMGNTLEGFMNVFSPYNNRMDMPFYRLTSQPSDTEAATAQIAGHYCLAMIEGDPSTLLPIIHDPSKVFGDDTSFIRPVALMSRKLRDIIGQPQYAAAKTASAFAAVDSVTLKPGESVTITSFYGKTAPILNVPVIATRILQPGFGQYKQTRLREIVKQITAQIDTHTANAMFDGHIEQAFLDSSLNGGVATMFGEVDDNIMMYNVDEDKRLKVYHLFSRNHGDLERDYNDFQVNPTFFSEGPGRFNDLAQHRRNDVFFNPNVGSFNIRMFLSLLQADGYNPLTVESVAFTIDNKIACDEISEGAVGQADGHRAQREALSNILNGGPFRLGQLFELMYDANIELIIPIHVFVDMVAAAAETHPMAVYGSGFWADHWTYFMDFIDSYLAVYPDQEERLLFDEKVGYFYSPAFVRPRRQKYVVSLNYEGDGEHVRQLDAVVQDDKKESYRMRYFRRDTGQFDLEANWQHDTTAEIFESSIIEKLIGLATIKFSSRCPYGMSIEYEAGKPGYNTAMNGLPSMLGGGVSELYELLRLLRYLLKAVTRFSIRVINLPVEVFELMESINDALITLAPHQGKMVGSLSLKVPAHLFVYWDQVASAREFYRERVRTEFDGATKPVKAVYMKTTLESWIIEVEDGLARAMSFGSRGDGEHGTTGLSPTYFSYNVTRWEETGEVNSMGLPYANATHMVVNRFPLFLEGPTRMMQTVSPVEAREIYNKVRQSPLRDKGLRMYTFSASLKEQSQDSGRAKAFAPGWLENESVWMEMSYRFYRQLLQNNMAAEFFDEMLSGGMLPFMNPQQYGRSLMECSEFLASSAFEDPSKHGRGFYARITGATSEFLTMWIYMFIGQKPFYIDEATGETRMQLLPTLPFWLFRNGSTEVDGMSAETPTISFKLFGSIDVRYYNEGGIDLFQLPPYRYVVGYRDGSMFEVDGPTIPFGLADKIRRVVFVASIDVYFR